MGSFSYCVSIFIETRASRASRATAGEAGLLPWWPITCLLFLIQPTPGSLTVTPCKPLATTYLILPTFLATPLRGGLYAHTPPHVFPSRAAALGPAFPPKKIFFFIFFPPTRAYARVS